MRKKRRSGGQSLVEFALVLPVFLLLLGGIIDFGFMFYSRITVINAAREGARSAVTAIDNPTSIPSLVTSSVTASASGLVPADLSDTATCVGLTQVSCDFAAGGKPDPQPGDAVMVTVTYTYHSFFAQLFGTSFALKSSVQMVIE
jgi:Flp pilus assembly protein TadG